MAKDQSIRKTKLPPTLIIGLGGTGCDIISRVDRLANQEQRQFIRFVFFDTDANELRQRKEEAPHTHTVQTSRRLTVGQALRNDQEARLNTFPINQQLLNKPLTEGAGQVRAISKLAFDACLREGRIKPLHDAIDDLQKLNGDDMEQSMRVVIVSTLVGGTGSGILLPVSMYLRHYLETTCQKKPIIRGFVVLPDVFFHGEEKAETEKNNLRTNAYATLRELDAFMLKADSTMSAELRDRYSLKMPRPGTVNEYDDYSDNPMDFCFLFDGQNIDGDGLQSFEGYKQHAADCIYASSISRLNKRLNSSEDNTILERCAANGRNRYCGIGTSKIIYPFKDVRDYIAMNWMQQAMTEHWMRYDKKYDDEMVKRQASRARGAGMHMKPIDRGELYCQLIESEVDEHNYFSMALYEECYNKDKQGLSFTDPRWVSYHDQLKKFIDDQTKDTSFDNGISDKADEKIMALQGSMEDPENFKAVFPQLTQLLKMFFNRTKRYAEDTATVIADNIFSPDNFNVKSEHHIEHWLTQNDIPLHPNAIRFFLYSLLKILKEDLRQSDTESSQEDGLLTGERTFADLEKAVNGFFEDKRYTLQIGDSEPQEMNITTYVNSLRKKGLMSKGGQSKDELNDSLTQIINECVQHKEDIRLYYAAYLRRTITKKAIEFVEGLISSYENFYSLLDTEIKRIPHRIQKLEENFINSNGTPIMYVCSSKVCLQGLLERCPNTIDPVALTEDFRKALFQGIFNCMKVDEKKRQIAVEGLVSKDILQFWRDSVMDQYKKNVDMDILEALAVQAELEDGVFGAKDQFYYIAHKKDEAYKLAAPFIDRPIGREPYIIQACTMASSVTRTDDINKSEIISRIFTGCERDDLMDRYQIVFMKALYNLRISDLLKFAPEDNSDVDPHAAGDYYKAYRARINSILPDPEKTRNITPHLDKKWHFIGVLPDLDEKSEMEDFKQAQEAFLLSGIYGYVRFNQDQYRFINEKGDFMSDSIVVADGKCNKFHEIYEAMLINRPLVLSVLKRFNDSTEKERKEEGIGNRDFRDSKMYNKLNMLKVHFCPQLEKVSIIELPLLYKASMGNSDFKDDDAIVMLVNFIACIEEYLGKFYPNVLQRDLYLAKWLNEQIMTMFENVSNHYESDPNNVILANPFHDALLLRIMNNVFAKFESIESSKEVTEIYAEVQKEWNAVKQA